MVPVPRFTLRDIAVAVAINLVWGLNFIAVKFSVAALPPFTAALLRQAILLAACAAFLRIVPGRMRALVGLGVIAGGVFLVCVNLSLVVSENIAALAIANQLGAPFALVLAVIFLGERIGLPRITGIALSIIGCGLLAFDPRIVDERLGLALTIAATFVWAVGSLLQRQLAGVPVLTIYAWIGLIGVASLAPIVAIAEPHGLAAVVTASPFTLGCVVFSALGSTLVGQGGMAWLLQRHPVSTVIPLTLAAPIITVVASSLIFATPVTPLMIAGGLIALAGVAIVSIRTAVKGEVQP